ncbi:WRKY Transcription Factor [Ranunculus cassubicifolius]
MENSKDLISELVQGKELVDQLRYHLNPTSQAGEVLIEQILSTVNKALSMLNYNGTEAESQVKMSNIRTIESPQSGSPRSEDSDIRDVYNKKRKTMPRWTEQIRISPGNGPEGPHEDGHSWRKYGQKDILGAKHPRGYYRCTHRTVQGCSATKQVQRSDEDPFVFDVTYRGKHTCIQGSQIMHRQNTEPLLEQRKRKQQSDDLLKKFQAELTVKTESQDITPFSFPSSTTVPMEDSVFSSLPIENDNFMGSFSSYMSPTTPDSNYFLPYHMNNIGNTSNFQSFDSELNEMISAATSPTNSPVGDLGFTLDALEFDDTVFPFQFTN